MRKTMINVRRAAKIALLTFGLFPFISFACFFVMLEPGETTTGLLFKALFFLAYVSVPGTLIYYIVHACKNKHIPKDQRNLWIALLFFGNICVYPFYWYLHIWRERKEDRTVGSNTRPC